MRRRGGGGGRERREREKEGRKSKNWGGSGGREVHVIHYPRPSPAFPYCIENASIRFCGNLVGGTSHWPIRLHNFQGNQSDFSLSVRITNIISHFSMEYLYRELYSYSITCAIRRPLCKTLRGQWMHLNVWLGIVSRNITYTCIMLLVY